MKIGLSTIVSHQVNSHDLGDVKFPLFFLPPPELVWHAYIYIYGVVALFILKITILNKDTS